MAASLKESHSQELKELEELFKDRFTDKEGEYKRCQSYPAPPIIPNFTLYDDGPRDNRRHFEGNRYGHPQHGVKRRFYDQSQ